MKTMPHLSQIQSSDKEKYDNLLEEILDINSNVEDLIDLRVNNIVDTHEDLEDLENKEIGFYLVRQDETYRGNPTHYFYEGTEFKMVGGEVPEGAFKKTPVFYIKKYTEVGHRMRLYIPHKGYINNITLCMPEEKEVKFKLWEGEELIEEFESSSSFMQWNVYYEVDNPILILEMVGEEVDIEDISINIDIILE